MVKKPKVPVFLSQSTQVAYSFTVFLKSTLYLLMKIAVVWNLRGYEGNCKHHKSRSIIRCLSIIGCNNHKAFKRSQENIAKPMRIHKHFTPHLPLPTGCPSAPTDARSGQQHKAGGPRARGTNNRTGPTTPRAWHRPTRTTGPGNLLSPPTKKRQQK